MSLGYSNFLSLNSWISEVIGSFILACLLVLVLITYTCIKNNLGFKPTFVLNLIGIMAMMSIAYAESFIIIIAVILVFIIYGVYAIFINR
jgi:hypothetical protein